MSMYKPERTDIYSKPDTIDFPKKQEALAQNKWLTIFLVGVAWFIVLVLFLYNLNKGWYITLPLGGVGAYGFILLVRYVFLDEAKVSESMEYFLKNDFNINSDGFWNIYEISDQKPYVVSYLNGMRGVFLQCHKDVVVGKGGEARFNHYEGVERMYREALSRGLYMVAVDVMTEVQNDVDYSQMYDFFSKSDMPILQNMMEEIMGHNQRLMTAQYSKNDVLLLLTRGTLQELEEGISAVIAASKDSNYHKITFSDKEAIQNLTKNLLNLEQFSINQALSDTLLKVSTHIIQPIKVTDSMGNELERFGHYTWELSERIAMSTKNKQTKVTRPQQNNNKKLQDKPEELVDLFDDRTGFLDVKPIANNTSKDEDEDEEQIDLF